MTCLYVNFKFHLHSSDRALDALEFVRDTVDVFAYLRRESGKRMSCDGGNMFIESLLDVLDWEIDQCLTQGNCSPGL